MLPAGWQAIDPIKFEIGYWPAPQLVRYDLNQIVSCNAMLVRAFAPSWGTAMELYHASNARIPVVAWVADTQAPQSPWLMAHITHKVGSLAAAMQVIGALVG